MKTFLTLFVLFLVGFSGSVYAEVIQLKCENISYSWRLYNFEENQETKTPKIYGNGTYVFVEIDTEKKILKLLKSNFGIDAFEFEIDEEEDEYRYYVFSKIKANTQEGDMIIENIEINRYTGFMNYFYEYKNNKTNISIYEDYSYICTKTKKLF
jgi:hypothetical protein